MCVKMRSIRRICRVGLADQILKEEKHRMAGTIENVKIRMKNVPRSCGHVERMSDERMAKTFII